MAHAIRITGHDDGFVTQSRVDGPRKDEQRVWRFTDAADAMDYLQAVFAGTNEPVPLRSRPMVTVIEAVGGLLTRRGNDMPQYWAMPGQVAALKAWLIAQYSE